ncbi:MAG: hypothetical protein BMS9Abin34_192 [Patescibacteria group bacterium]|nr:MAG: hypothetical protein BMS9Abin34_192 [Patescibacteria group bacterium]
MVLSTRSKFLIGVIILVEAVLIVAGVTYRQNFNRDFELVANEGFNRSAVLDIRDELSFPTSFTDIEIWGFQVASTGRVYEYTLKDAQTGDEFGVATVLDTVTRDRDDPDNLKRLPLVVQFSLSSDPSRNLMPWVSEKAAKLNPQDVAVGSDFLSTERIAQIFPQGGSWVFVPLLDLTREELGQIVEYIYYAQRYYGGTTYPDVEKLIKDSPDKHALLGEAGKPIFILATFSYMGRY